MSSEYHPLLTYLQTHLTNLGSVKKWEENKGSHQVELNVNTDVPTLWQALEGETVHSTFTLHYTEHMSRNCTFIPDYKCLSSYSTVQYMKFVRVKHLLIS